MSEHPLLDLANTAEIKQVKSFREAAERMTGASLAEMFAVEKSTAAAESDSAPKHFLDHDGTIEGEVEGTAAEFAIAIHNSCQEEDYRIALPADGPEIEILDYHVVMTALPPSRRKARFRPVHTMGLMGSTPEGRLAVITADLMPAKSTKGDTPLKMLLEALALAAATEAHRSALTAQASEKFGREISGDPPLVIVLANARYWDLFRKRGAKTAGPWIVQIERLVREIRESLSLDVYLLATRLYGDPGWRLRQSRPLLETAPRVVSGLETPSSERRTRSRSRSSAPDEVIEADPERPVRSYDINEFYFPGDSIQHPTLGSGVVQKVLGPNKVEVLFDDTARVLAQGRGGTPTAVSAG